VTVCGDGTAIAVSAGISPVDALAALSFSLLGSSLTSHGLTFFEQHAHSLLFETFGLFLLLSLLALSSLFLVLLSLFLEKLLLLFTFFGEDLQTSLPSFFVFLAELFPFGTFL
jgi:hypothetical protein